MRKNKWTPADRQAFTDANLRAQTIPARRHDGPEAEEWDDDIIHITRKDTP